MEPVSLPVALTIGTIGLLVICTVCICAFALLFSIHKAMVNGNIVTKLVLLIPWLVMGTVCFFMFLIGGAAVYAGFSRFIRDLFS